MATISSYTLNRMAVTYNAAYARIVARAEASAAQAWQQLDSFDDEAEEEWAAVYWMLIWGAVQTVARLTTAYMSAQINYLGTTTVLPVPDLEAIARNEFAKWSISPIVRTRWLVSEGIDPRIAIAETTARTTKLVDAAIRIAEREARDQLFDAIDRGPTYLYDARRPDTPIPPPQTPEGVNALAADLTNQGYRMSKKGVGALRWRREPAPGAVACGWCTVMSARLLSERSREEGNKWHTNCRCRWRMVTTEESRNWTDPYADGKWKDIIGRRSQPEPASQPETETETVNA